ncbi:hypothetical protein KIN20_000302 [Parelaphostrongylus tenuis]|uniref:Uncharacterized protein n=1 Tax=Parelaphostrongylus tenuis TaxID=148309 RepID=A0AAD5LVX5_PARTN|nr:hypothetical protein KIN20_000302 [Parelaphostrongylus tenuis]
MVRLVAGAGLSRVPFTDEKIFRVTDESASTFQKGLTEVRSSINDGPQSFSSLYGGLGQHFVTGDMPLVSSTGTSKSTLQLSAASFMGHTGP